MSKTGPIAHAPNTALVIIRKDYLDLCEGDHCAAAILNVFEYWHGIKLAQAEQTAIEANIAAVGGVNIAPSDTWVWKSIPAIQDELLGLFGERKVSAALTALTTKGYLSSRNNPNYGWDRTLQYQFNVDAIQAGLDNLPSRKNAACKPQKCGIVDAKVRHQSREFAAAIPETTTENQNITFVAQAPDEAPDLFPLQGQSRYTGDAFEEEKTAAPLIPDLVYEDLETSKKRGKRSSTRAKEKNASKKEVNEPSESAEIVGIISAYLKGTGAVQPNAYANKTNRAIAKALLEIGITRTDVAEYIDDVITGDTFWRGKTPSLQFVANGIGRWKEDRTSVSGITEDNFTPVQLDDELAAELDELLTYR